MRKRHEIDKRDEAVCKRSLDPRWLTLVIRLGYYASKLYSIWLIVINTSETSRPFIHQLFSIVSPAALLQLVVTGQLVFVLLY